MLLDTHSSGAYILTMTYRFATATATAAAPCEPRPELLGRVFTSEQPLTNDERHALWRWRLANHRSAERARLTGDDDGMA